MTLLIEAVGLLILLIWVVIPVQEFQQIFRTLSRRNEADAAAAREKEIG